ACLLGIGREEVPDVSPEYAVDRRLTRPEAVEDLAEGLEVPRLSEEDDVVAQRPGRVAEELGRRRVGEPSVRLLAEDAEARERTEHPVERSRLRAGRRRELLGALRAAREDIRHAERGRGP